MNQCPHCQHELTTKEIAVLYAGLRKNNRGGRPRKLPRCYKCEKPIRPAHRQATDANGEYHLNCKTA